MIKTPEHAIDIAKTWAADQGWYWIEPGEAIDRVNWRGQIDRWEVWDNANGYGAQCRVIVDAGTGEVIESAYIEM